MKLVYRQSYSAIEATPCRPSSRRGVAWLATTLVSVTGLAAAATAQQPEIAAATDPAVVTADAAGLYSPAVESMFAEGEIQQVVGKQLNNYGRRLRTGSSGSSNTSGNASPRGFLSGLFGGGGSSDKDDSGFVPTPAGELQGDVGEPNWDGVPYHRVTRGSRGSNAGRSTTSRSSAGRSSATTSTARTPIASSPATRIASRTPTTNRVSATPVTRGATNGSAGSTSRRDGAAAAMQIPRPPAEAVATESNTSTESSRRFEPVSSSRRSGRRVVSNATTKTGDAATSTASGSQRPDYSNVADLVPKVSRKKVTTDRATATKSAATQSATTKTAAAAKPATSKPSSSTASQPSVAKTETKKQPVATASKPTSTDLPTTPKPTSIAKAPAANTTSPTAKPPTTPAPSVAAPSVASSSIATPAATNANDVASNTGSTSSKTGYQNLGFFGPGTAAAAASPTNAPSPKPMTTMVPVPRRQFAASNTVASGSTSPSLPTNGQSSLTPTKKFASDPFAGRDGGYRTNASTASAAIGSGVAAPPSSFVAQPADVHAGSPAKTSPTKTSMTTAEPPVESTPQASIAMAPPKPAATTAPMAAAVPEIRDTMSRRHWNDPAGDREASGQDDVMLSDRNDGRPAVDETASVTNDMRREMDSGLRTNFDRIEDRPGMTAIRSELPGLRVTTYGPKELTIRQTGEYEIRVENRGAIDAEGVLVRAFIPDWARLQGDSTTVGNVEKEAAGTAERLVWTIDQLPAGKTETLFVRLNAAQSGSYQMDVDWTLMPRKSIAKVQIHEPKLDLEIEGPDQIVFGQSESYKVRVINPGDGVAPNVVFILSPGSTPQTQRIGDIPAGKEAQFDVELTAQDLKDLVIHGLATGDLELRTEGEKTIRVLAAQFEAVLTGPEAKYQNTDATYSLELSNHGTAASQQVMAKLVLPPGVEYLGGIDGADLRGRELVWTIDALPIGGTVNYDFECRLSATGRQNFGFEARGSAAGRTDVSIATEVESIADLVLSINDPAAPAPIGSEVIYEIVIRNRGSRAAKDVQAVAQFSHGIEPVRIVGQTGQLMTGQVVFDVIPKIAANEEVKIRVVAVAEGGGHHRFRTEVTSDEIVLVAEEATHFMSRNTERITKRSGTPTAAEPLIR